ncbi:hypothetical protein LCGC14_1581280 [marine sediment metagenome]|uniref:Uncharacterized protein n=1 Tax=marine sediment metagenome TaxID=412755 RepID=A0A0F9LH16_9ZZZZ
MNKIVLRYDTREIKRGEYRDLRLNIESLLVESDPRGGRPSPFFVFSHCNAAGGLTLSIDLSPEEWETIIRKLQRKIGLMKGKK